MTFEDILQNLNPEQREAVLHVNGPLLIFAGAGSGKTRVITNRAAYLMYSEHISPDSILSVTFTKKAAEEMRSRIVDILESLGGAAGASPVVGTFHSIGAQILRKDGHLVGLDTNFTITDSDDVEALVKDIMLEKNYDIKQYKPKAVISYMEEAKNNMIAAEDYSLYYSGFFEDIVAEVYEVYQQRLNDINAVDFGDLLYLPYKLFKNDPSVLKKYRDKYRYVQVDEYQDTNKVQYELVKLLAGENHNICVVGDDDQGIYKWRGADVKNIIFFQKDFPDAKVIKLEQNYRSVGNVINAAMSVIKRNIERADKTLWTAREEGEKITVYQAQDEVDEGNFVIDEFSDLRREGFDYNDIAILYRTNYQSRAIEESLLRRGVPYRLIGGFRFYDRREIKDILSYLRYIFNPKDYMSLLRIINVPSRKLGSKTISTLAQCAKSVNAGIGEFLIGAYNLENNCSSKGKIAEIASSISDRSVDYSKFKNIVDLFGSLYYESRGMQAAEVIDLILRKTKYIDFVNDGTEEGEAKVDNIKELRGVAAAYTGERSLNDFLEAVALIEDVQKKSKKDLDENKMITLMTIHSAKGLEFPVVFIIGMEEGLLPHSRSLTEQADLEEERRLCYVGITRAKDRLYLTFAESRNQGLEMGWRTPSRFLGEIPQDICEYYSWKG